MKYKLVPIGNHIRKVISWSPAKEIPDECFAYIDLSSIDKEFKCLIPEQVQNIPAKEAPSRARQLVELNDVLISTVRPNLNGVAYLNQNFLNATASTGYCVLRVDEALSPKFLYYWVRSKTFVEDMVKKATGASYPAVSDKTIKESKIPLPPIDQQKKIAAILDTADTYRQKTKALITKYEELTQSLFLDMFGDPVANNKRWKVNKLKDLSSKIHSGNTPKGGSKVYVNEGITFFRSQNVWKNDIVYDNVAFIDEATHKSMMKSNLKHRDILITKTGRVNTEKSSLGRAAMYLGENDKANLNGHVYLIRLNEGVINEFVLHILTSPEYRDHIRRTCVGGIDKRQLNKEHIEDFPIITPPQEMQKQFVDRLLMIQEHKVKLNLSLDKAEDLFNSLLQKAFKGELV